METRTKLIRLPSTLLNWIDGEAKNQKRSANAEIEMALTHWRETRMKTYLPEEKDLSIDAETVAWDRKIIAGYEAKIKEFEAKADASRGSRRGAYKSQVTQRKKALDRMSGNLAYHLAWLKRYRPEVYEQVK